jgi:hypothetical protein
LKPYKYLAICGIIAPLTYFGAEFTAPLFFPGYNHLTQLMSELGETGAPYASFVIANVVGMALTGFLLILFTIGFFYGIESSALSRLLPALLLAAMGGCFIVASAYHCDPGCINTTASGSIHTLFGGTIASILFVFTPLAAAYALFRDKRWNRLYMVYSLLTVAVTVLFGAPYVAPAIFDNMSGLWQRTEALVMFLYLAIISTKLLRI